MRAIVIGSEGFVGSAFVRRWRAEGVEVVEVNRRNYEQQRGAAADVTIEAACNSKKFWAEERPFEEFDEGRQGTPAFTTAAAPTPR